MVVKDAEKLTNNFAPSKLKNIFSKHDDVDNHEQNEQIGEYRKTLNVEYFEGVNKDLVVQQETVKDRLAKAEAVYATEKADCNKIAKDAVGLQDMNARRRRN